MIAGSGSVIAAVIHLPSLMTNRKSNQESLDRLRQDYASFIDENQRVEFFRTFVGDGDDLSGLSLPKTFFGRSEINNCSFANTDLSESTMCWNDFVDVDFTDGDLTNSDLRASNYSNVRFVRCDLKGADLRRSNFNNCDFAYADLEFATITPDQVDMMNLTGEQLDCVNISVDAGPEPYGG